VLRQPGGGARIAEIFTCTEARCADAQFYATSWALYSYLANRRPDSLLRYVRRLVELQEDGQAAAWQDVFPELTPDKLDSLLDDWIKNGDLTVHHYKVKLKDVTVARRVLGDSEVYTARALLRRRTGRRPSAEVTAEVTAALLADPDNVVANMINMDGVQKPDLEIARRLTTVHPDDWRAWWLHKLVTEDRDEAERDQARACALVARAPAVLPRSSCPSATPRK
jgi:hypothetical protein